ncbi:MAG: DUF2933 domain-containing protein [Actinomycetota bacterium]|nr:DUF2933 domain-containing protein [Actinomycetota bacterium]
MIWGTQPPEEGPQDDRAEDVPQPEGAGRPGGTGGRELPVAPELVSAALPYLLLAICPLSMPAIVPMMSGVRGEGVESGEQGAPRVGDTPGLTREERIARPWEQQLDLAERVDASEHEEPWPAKTTRGAVVRRQTEDRVRRSGASTDGRFSRDAVPGQGRRRSGRDEQGSIT